MMAKYCCVSALIAATASSAFAQSFTNVTRQAGVDYLHYDPSSVESGIHNLPMTGGAAVGDADGDGWPDLYVTRLDQPDLLFRNLGVGGGVHLGFEDVTSRSFPGVSVTNSNGAAFGDIDNDGDHDLYVTATKDTRYYLYINDGSGTFTEEALARGAAVDKPDMHYGNGIALGDYDNDGFLDVFTSEWRNSPCNVNPTLAPSNTRLLRNLGTAAPGFYEDVTEAAGVSIDHVAQQFHGRTYEGAAFAFAPRFTDLDADGNQDLIMTSDFGTSRLFWNNGDGTFSDGTVSANVGTDRNGMGSTVGDYDGDGLLDWFVTAIDTEQGNRLYRNQGDRTFSDETDAAGVRRAGWGWGATFLDYDNDGDQDITMTNGFNVGTVPDDRTTLFRNDGGRFTDVSDVEGITDTGQGRGLLTFDYDLDGDLDVFIANNGGHPVLYRNEGSQNSWLRVSTEGTRSNRDGIGARVTIVPDTDEPSNTMVREIDGGSNYLAHNELTAHFGLGPFAEAVDLVRVRWPSGIVQEFHDVAPNQILQAIEPDRPLTEAELADTMLRAPGENQNDVSPSADNSPPEAEADSVDFYDRPDIDMTVVYDRASGRVSFEGSDWHKYISISMELSGEDHNPADIRFQTHATGWSQRDVYSFLDEETAQGYESYVGCVGNYVVRGGQAFDGLLPAGLARQQVLDHLTVQYTLAGVPGTRHALITVIPEPPTWTLAALGILSVIAQARRLRFIRNTK